MNEEKRIKTERYRMVKDTRVYWDEDYDERVIPVTEALIALFESRMGYNPVIAVHEHEGLLYIYMDIHWKDIMDKEADDVTANQVINTYVQQVGGMLILDCWDTEIMVVDTYG